MRRLIHVSRQHWQVIVAMLITSLVYSNIFGNQFVWDDTSFILNWPELKTFHFHLIDFFKGQVASGHEGLYRPIRSVLYGLAYQIWGESPWGYHLQSLVVHLMATALMYWLAQRLAFPKPIPTIATLLFGVHPIHVEAITWITPSFDIVGVVFAVGSFIAYTYWREKQNKIVLLLCLSLATLAYFTNEITLVLPGICAAYDFFIGMKKPEIIKAARSSLSHWLLIFTPALVYLVIRFWFLDIRAREEMIYGSLWVTFLLMSVAIIKQLMLFIWPWPLTVNHQLLPNYTALFYHEVNLQQIPPAPRVTQLPVFLSLITITGLILVIWRIRKSHPKLIFLICWHGLAILPLMQIVPQSIIFGERYLYFASFGTLMLLAWAISSAAELLPYNKMWTAYLLTGIVCFPLGYISYQRNFDWYSEQTLWQTTLDVGPRTPYALSNLAKYYHEQGDTAKALELLEEAYEINPNHVIAGTNLGLVYTSLKRPEEALAIHHHIYKLSPTYLPNIENLAAAYLQLQDYSKALEWYSKYRDAKPNDPQAQFKLASAFHTAYIYDRALIEYQRAIDLDPTYVAAYANRGQILYEMVQLIEALESFQTVKQLQPDYPEIDIKLTQVKDEIEAQANSGY